MRRPTRTRRLSIAAIASLLTCLVVAGAADRSLKIEDYWNLGKYHSIALESGCLSYQHVSGKVYDRGIEPAGHRSIPAPPVETSRVLNFSVDDFTGQAAGTKFRKFTVRVPLWFPLLFLLIAPLYWLIARPANPPAFPVVTDARKE